MAFALIRHTDDDRLRALDPLTTRAELVQLAAHRHTEIRAMVAARTDCPLAAMLSLVHEADQRVLEALAANPMSPRAVLEVLVTSKRDAVRALASRRLRALAVPV